MTATWEEIKSALLPNYGFLSPFVPTVDKATIDRINELLNSGKLEQFRYEPLLVESLLADCSTLLDRCLAYRREAREFEAEAVRFAIEYEKTNELLDLEERLDKSTSEQHLLAAEAQLLGVAAEQFSEATDLGPGFSMQTRSASDTASARSQIWESRIKILGERRAVLRKWQEAYMARHKAPGTAHNYEERMSRLVQFLAEDLYEAHRKSDALFQGIRRIHGSEVLLPPLAEGVLDELVSSVRRASRLMDAHRQNEITYDLVVPLCQPWNASSAALIDAKQLLEYGKNPHRQPLSFELANVFHNQTNVRIRAVGLSFGNTDEPRSTSTSTSSSSSSSKPWGISGQTDTTGTSKSESDGTAMAAVFAKYRIRATIHTPEQENEDGSKYSRPPIVLGNLSIFGGGAPIALETGPQCQNIDPTTGKWRIFLENSAVHSGPSAIPLFDKKGRSVIHDLKLHLRIAATFTSGDSAFRPKTRRRSAK